MAHARPLPSFGFLSFILLAIVIAVPARDKDDWPPISPEELGLKDNPVVPGSTAMILLKEDSRDDKKGVRELYYRIKIFNEEGRKYADIEIPYARDFLEVKDIAARTVQFDGRIVEFHGAIFEKTLALTRKRRVLAKTFTLPEVQPGSIIEYRYELKNKEGHTFGSIWFFQEPLFVREARLTLRPGQGTLRTFSRLLPRSDRFHEDDDGIWRMTLRELPAFERESYMVPRRELEMRVHLIYGWAADKHPDFFWEEDIGKWWAKLTNDFIGKPKEFRGIVQQLVSAQDPPETKLRKLYEAVQDRIRNLSYEETYTKKERKREKMKERKSSRDVWKYGYGNAWELARLFAALCRAAGFTAQLDGEIVVVDLPEGPRYFDPGTRFAPFGQLSWENQGTTGLRSRKKRAELLVTPLSRAEENIRHRRITLELQPNGTAHVRVVVQYTGQRAVERKNDFFELSSEQREHKLREELEKRFPAAQLKEITWKGLDRPDDAVEFSYTFEIPDCALVLGSRLLVQPALFASQSSFRHWKRKYPVYLHFPYSHVEEVQVVPPEGFEVEYLPVGADKSTGLGRYEVEVSNEGNTVLYRKKVTVQGILFRGDWYGTLKGYFDTIQAGDQLHLVLRQP
jgi:hypothetical protein